MASAPALGYIPHMPSTRPKTTAALGGAALSAALYWMAFPPLALWPLLFVCMAPVLSRGPDLSWGRRLLVGWLFSSLVHGSVYYWIFHTAQSMSGLSVLLAGVVLLAFALAHGTIGGAWLLLLGWLAPRERPLLFGLSAAALWALLEALFPFLFPWFIGNALYRTPVMMQAADLGGVHLLSFCLVLPAAVLARALPPHRRLAARQLAPAGAALLVTAGGLLAYGLWRMPGVDAARTGSKLRVGIVQPYITGELKLKRAIDARKHILELTYAAEKRLKGERDLTIWPEGAFPFYFRPKDLPGVPKGRETWPHRYTRKLIEHARRSGRPLLAGTLRRPHEERTRNSAVLIRKDGSFSIYDKRLLVAFGERLPMRSLLKSLVGKIRGVSDMKPGEELGVFEVAGTRFLMHICYETIFPQRVRSDVRATRPDMILNLTNDVWFGPTVAPELHLMVQTVRAVETRLPIVRVTNSGISALVDRAGRIVERTPVYEQAARTWEVKTGALPSPYMRFGDVFLWGAAAMALLLAGLARVLKGRR